MIGASGEESEGEEGGRVESLAVQQLQLEEEKQALLRNTELVHEVGRSHNSWCVCVCVCMCVCV